MGIKQLNAHELAYLKHAQEYGIKIMSDMGKLIYMQWGYIEPAMEGEHWELTWKFTGLADAILNTATEPAATPLTGAREAGGVLATVEEAYELGDYVKHQNGYEIYRYANHYYAYYNGIKQHDGIALVLVERWIDNQQLPATPQPETVGTGDGEPVYRVELQNSLTTDATFYVLLSPSGEELASVSTRWGDDTELNNHAELLNTETRTLRTELAAARERIAELTAAVQSIHAKIESDSTPVAILGAIHELITPYLAD